MQFTVRVNVLVLVVAMPADGNVKMLGGSGSGRSARMQSIVGVGRNWHMVTGTSGIQRRRRQTSSDHRRFTGD